MEVDIIFKIAAVGLIVAILNHILTRSQREEYTMITTIAGLIIVLMMLLPGIDELFKYIRSVFNI
ncbi:MAG: stage III sporulation protein AC [Clostridiales bacterium]|jgi:stage III sporulation protein AC|nr:stage III sporulation protein AC [Clostridiales bacterium]